MIYKPRTVDLASFSSRFGHFNRLLCSWEHRNAACVPRGPRLEPGAAGDRRDRVGLASHRRLQPSMSIRLLYIASGTWNGLSNHKPFEAWICLLFAKLGILPCNCGMKVSAIFGWSSRDRALPGANRQSGDASDATSLTRSTWRRTSVFSKTCRRWVLTVALARPRAFAISRWVRPATINSTMRTSAGVRP